MGSIFACEKKKNKERVLVQPLIGIHSSSKLKTYSFITQDFADHVEKA